MENFEKNPMKMTNFTSETIVEKLLQHKVIETKDDIELLSFNNLSTDDSFNWASMVKVTLKLKKDKYPVCTIPLIVKLQRDNDKVREQWRLNQMYVNEILIYGKVLPLFCPDNIFPKFYGGKAEHEFGDFVIMTDMKSMGFEMAKDFLVLPDDHMVLALKKLGLFHGSFYAYKETHLTEILSLMKEIKETRFFPNLPADDMMRYFTKNFCQGSMRGVKLLEECGQYDDDLVEGLKDIFLNQQMDFFLRLVVPEEPLAVLCHGDFNRNNLMYKYNKTTHEPEDVVFFDLQTPRYGSPAFDLSFIFMMNLPTEKRDKNFDRYMKIYHDSVIQTLEESYPNYDRDKYSYEKFLADYGRHSLYGYSVIAFFYPLIDALERAKIDPESKQDNIVDFLALTQEEYLAHFAKMYTNETDNYLFNCLKELCDRFGKVILI